jgi:mono/diheme cytochrome c family protein
MKHWPLWAGILLVIGAGAGLLLLEMTSPGRPVVINNTAVPPVPALDARAVEQGAQLYAQHCAECHGANLEGAPDWKQPLPDGSFPPPPHDVSGHTWHHPDPLILSLIADGGDPAHNSKMPAFKDKLSSEEMNAILEFVKSKWGREEREFQWWVTAAKSGN